MQRNLSLKAVPSARTQKHARHCGFRPSLEALEDRRLLSITSTLFVLDQTASALTLSGDVAGYPLQQQGDGALTSHYSGTMIVDWDLDGLTINLDQSGSALNAMVTGNWQPNRDGMAGSALADYGGRLTILLLTARIAVRDLVLAASTASPLPLSGPGPYTFPSTEMLTVRAGTADYDAGALGSGSKDLSVLSAPNTSPDPSTFEDLGNGSYRFTLPISLTIQQTIDNLPATLHIDGQIVATAVIPVVNLSDGTTSNFDYSTSTAGGGPVAIEDPAAAVSYTPSGKLTSLTVTLINYPDGAAEFLGYDLGDSGLTTNGYDPTTGQLIITGSADAAAYQNVLRSISYENDSPSADTHDRQIQFVVSDGTNSSVVRTTTVHIGAPAARSALGASPGLVNGLQCNGLVAVVGSQERAALLGPAARIVSVLLSDTESAAKEFAITLDAIPSRRASRSGRAALSRSDAGLRVPFGHLLPTNQAEDWRFSELFS